jgi:hypothetical protein
MTYDIDLGKSWFREEKMQFEDFFT